MFIYICISYWLSVSKVHVLSFSTLTVHNNSVTSTFNSIHFLYTNYTFNNVHYQKAALKFCKFELEKNPVLIHHSGSVNEDANWTEPPSTTPTSKQQSAAYSSQSRDREKGEGGRWDCYCLGLNIGGGASERTLKGGVYLFGC